MGHTLKVGDTLYSSWGYDQTNVDFFRVVKVTAQTVTLNPLRKRIVSEENSSAKVEPIEESTGGKILRRKVHTYGDEPSVSISSFASAQLWDGRPKYETASGWGH